MRETDQPERTRAPADVLEDVALPLKNVEFTIEQYLLAHGSRLDLETRVLLAGVRDSVGRVAGSTRRILGRTAAATGLRAPEAEPKPGALIPH